MQWAKMEVVVIIDRYIQTKMTRLTMLTRLTKESDLSETVSIKLCFNQA